MARRNTALLAAALLGLACASDTDDVLEAWRKAGEQPGDFRDVGAKLEGGRCRAGQVSGLDVTLCELGDAEAAKKAAEAGWKLVGSAVGTSLAAGKLVLVVSDPRKEDPRGRRIDTLARAFQAEAR